MTAKIEFFPVGSGDMTLITLKSGKKILIDINIRKKADDDNESHYPDVAEMLKNRLDRDDDDRLFVDVFMLSHPDADHCAGLKTHFHLKEPEKFKKLKEDEPEKILIREMWSSPLTFRRKNKDDGSFTKDAEAWKDEAKRRAKLHKKDDESKSDDGNKILILGEDVRHKTKGLESILVKVGDTINKICGSKDDSFSGLLLSPKLVTDDEVKELKGKNNSSIVMQFTLQGDEQKDAVKFLTGGDAEVDIWERIWERNKSSDENLRYNVLQTPHHSSLGCLSRDRYDDKRENCEISDDAHDALSQALDGAYLIASTDEPEGKSGRGLAQRKYKKIAKDCKGKFLCTMKDSADKPLLITITGDGPSDSGKKKAQKPIPDKVKKPKTEGAYA